MKYLKKFENEEEVKKYFWSVRNDKYYLIKQLRKINCPELKECNFGVCHQYWL